MQDLFKDFFGKAIRSSFVAHFVENLFKLGSLHFFQPAAYLKPYLLFHPRFEDRGRITPCICRPSIHFQYDTFHSGNNCNYNRYNNESTTKVVKNNQQLVISG